MNAVAAFGMLILSSMPILIINLVLLRIMAIKLAGTSMGAGLSAILF